MESGFYFKLLADGKLREKDKEPQLGYYSFFIEAFSEVHSARPQTGFGYSYIPFHAILEYADFIGYEDKEEFLYFMRVIDIEFVRLNNDGAKNKNNHSQGKR